MKTECEDKLPFFTIGIDVTITTMLAISTDETKMSKKQHVKLILC